MQNIMIIKTLIITILFGSYDLFIKLAATKATPQAGSFVVQLTSTITLGLFMLFTRNPSQQPINLNKYAVIAGVLIALALLILFNTLNQPTIKASIILPTILTGRNITLISLSNIILKETLTTHQLVGLSLSLTGLYLINK